jgi:predicted site-specific integrase-resolvase
MPITINGSQYYQTHEACQMAGITKNTFLRWVSNGSLMDVSRRDRRGWRLFTEDDLSKLINEANRVQTNHG